MLERKGRIRVDGRFRDWVHLAMERMPVIEAPLTNAISLLSHDIQLGHADPADHFIAATAIAHELVLASVDERITEAECVATLKF